MANISSHTKKVLKNFLEKKFSEYHYQSGDVVDFSDYFSEGFIVKTQHEKQIKTDTPLYKISLNLKKFNNHVHFYMIEVKDGEVLFFEKYSDFFMDRVFEEDKLLHLVLRQCYIFHINFQNTKPFKEKVSINVTDKNKIFVSPKKNKVKS